MPDQTENESIDVVDDSTGETVRRQRKKIADPLPREEVLAEREAKRQRYLEEKWVRMQVEHNEAMLTDDPYSYLNEYAFNEHCILVLMREKHRAEGCLHKKFMDDECRSCILTQIAEFTRRIWAERRQGRPPFQPNHGDRGWQSHEILKIQADFEEEMGPFLSPLIEENTVPTLSELEDKLDGLAYGLSRKFTVPPVKGSETWVQRLQRMAGPEFEVKEIPPPALAIPGYLDYSRGFGKFIHRLSELFIHSLQCEEQSEHPPISNLGMYSWSGIANALKHDYIIIPRNEPDAEELKEYAVERTDENPNPLDRIVDLTHPVNILQPAGLELSAGLKEYTEKLQQDALEMLGKVQILDPKNKEKAKEAVKSAKTAVEALMQANQASIKALEKRMVELYNTEDCGCDLRPGLDHEDDCPVLAEIDAFSEEQMKQVVARVAECEAAFQTTVKDLEALNAAGEPAGGLIPLPPPFTRREFDEKMRQAQEASDQYLPVVTWCSENCIGLPYGEHKPECKQPALYQELLDEVMGNQKWPEFAIWWTTEADCRAQGSRLGKKIPEYIRRQYNDRYGRNGRGRLWCEKGFPTDCVCDQEWEMRARNLHINDRAGIVIRRQDVDRVSKLQGFITDDRLVFLVEQPSEDEDRYPRED